MTSKYIALYRFPRGRTYRTLFKWQWRVVYQVNVDGVWEQHEHIAVNRAMARYFKRNLPNTYGSTRWARIQRRLVQVDWKDYKDTFSYNEKGNGNGR